MARPRAASPLDNGIDIGGDPYNLNSEGTATTAQGIFAIPADPHASVANYNGDPSFNPVSVSGSGSTTLTISTTAAHSSMLDGSGWRTKSLGPY